MSPQVFDAFATLAAERVRFSGAPAALEVGAAAWTLLALPQFANVRRVAVNLRFDRMSPGLEGADRVIANGNNMPFGDAEFDCVLSSSTLEHDKYFWRTCREIRRVLKPGGVAILGVPIYMTLPTDRDFTTVTYARHGLAYNADFYRFSEQAVREVFFEGYGAVTDEVIVRTHPNPYLVAAARK
jgi:SAM-dependent methyltransferase